MRRASAYLDEKGFGFGLHLDLSFAEMIFATAWESGWIFGSNFSGPTLGLFP
jgi:hypothetical protein